MLQCFLEGYGTVQSSRRVPTFWRNIMPLGEDKSAGSSKTTVPLPIPRRHNAETNWICFRNISVLRLATTTKGFRLSIFSSVHPNKCRNTALYHIIFDTLSSSLCSNNPIKLRYTISATDAVITWTINYPSMYAVFSHMASSLPVFRLIFTTVILSVLCLGLLLLGSLRTELPKYKLKV